MCPFTPPRTHKAVAPFPRFPIAFLALLFLVVPGSLQAQSCANLAQIVAEGTQPCYNEVPLCIQQCVKFSQILYYFNLGDCENGCQSDVSYCLQTVAEAAAQYQALCGGSSGSSCGSIPQIARPAGSQPRARAMAASGSNASILMNGNDITGKTQTVVVGQQIHLTGKPWDGSKQCSDPWSVDGTIIDEDGFQPTSASADAPNYDVDMTQQEVTFFWVETGTFQVTFSPTLSSGDSVTPATVTFNVVGPTIKNLGKMVTWGTPQTCAGMLPNGKIGYEMVLDWTNCAPTGGIQFNPKIQDPDGFSGQVYWAQLITNPAFVWKPTPGTGICLAVGTVLDAGWPYPGRALPDKSPKTQDSPSISLPMGIGLTSASDGFSAQMFLLWQPDTSEKVTASTPVPLGSVQWQWSATTAFNKMYNAWDRPPDQRSPMPGTKPPAFQPDSTYPTWGGASPFIAQRCIAP
jgi:hypothetical protein